MISPAEMRVLDRNAQYFGVSILELMENAGKAVADAARSEFAAAGKSVLVLCGTGNNGGDGLVAARHLAKDARVTVLLARSPDQFATPEAAKNFERLRDVQILAGLDKSEEAIAAAELLIDALLGIGVEGPLREPYAALIRQMNASGKPILSVDVPSGFGTDRPVRPTVTVTLHDVKEGMTAENSGRIRVADIGIPTKIATMIGPGEFTLYRVPRATSHKGQNGRVLVIAGGPYTGAPALVGYGALGVGADLIHVATPALAASVVASYSPMFIVHPLVGHRLLREDTRQTVDLAARAFGATILLKGHVDIVTDGTRMKFNYTGNPGMTVGGTGDVLCGVVTGLMSKGMSPFDAARPGAFTNGHAGDLAFKVKSYGLTSVDVAENLGRVLAEFLSATAIADPAQPL